MKRLLRLAHTQPAREEALASFEDQMGSPIPAQYRQFLKDYGNGGQPADPACVYLPELSDATDLAGFLGVQREADYNLAPYNRREDLLFPLYWCVAYDSGGNLILIEASTGMVWYLETELKIDGSPHEPVCIASSFAAFLAGLVSEEQLDALLPKTRP
jgi:hypothetical protein